MLVYSDFFIRLKRIAKNFYTLICEKQLTEAVERVMMHKN